MANLNKDGRKHLHLTNVIDQVPPNGYINVFEEGQFTTGDTLYHNLGIYRLRLNLNVADMNGIEQLWVTSDPNLIPEGRYAITHDIPDPNMVVAGQSFNFNLNDDNRPIGTTQWLCLQGENCAPGVITGVETGPTTGATFSYSFPTAGWFTVVANCLPEWPTPFPANRNNTLEADHSAVFSFRVQNAPAGPQFIPGTSVTSPGTDTWTNPADVTDTTTPNSVVNIRLCPNGPTGSQVYYTLGGPYTDANLSFDPSYINFDGTNANTITAANSTMEKLMSIFEGSEITGPGIGTRKLIPFGMTFHAQPNPSDVGIYMVIDDSGSMSGTYRWWVQTATQAFLGEIPDGVKLDITYYWQGNFLNEVVDSSTRSKTIPAPASSTTPLYGRTLDGINKSINEGRSIKWVISQSDGAASDSGTAPSCITSASSSDVVMFMFATGGAADTGMKSIANDPYLSTIGSFFNRASSEDEQVGAFRALSTMLNKDTAILHCWISSSSSTERARPETGTLGGGTYTGKIYDHYHSGTHDFTLQI